jgi:hypothetical protein
MESVASCSPSPVSHNMVRMFPSADAVSMIETPGCARLALQRKGAGSTKDDERDDAYGSNKTTDGDRWNFEPKRSLPIHEMKFADASERNTMGNYIVDSRQTERHHHHPPADWHRQHHHISGRGMYGMAGDPSRHSVGMVPLSHDDHIRSRPSHHPGSYALQHGSTPYGRANPSTWSLGYEHSYQSAHLARISSSRGGRHPTASRHTSRVVIPKNLVIPRAISSPSIDGASRADDSGKRSRDSLNSTPSPSSSKKVKMDGKQDGGTFEMLDLLCSATLELGPLQENPTGCSCPKSKCIALYCDCFKAGRRCDPTTCTCLGCKNTIEESGINGARSKVSVHNTHTTEYLLFQE